MFPRIPVLALLVLALLAFPGSAVAANFVVNSTADDNDGECVTDCTLRDALSLANGNGQADVITFSGPTTINVGAALPITGDTTITGQGSGVSGTVLDGGGSGRIFTITGNVAVTIGQLRMVGGQAGSTGGGGDEGGSAIGHATGTLSLDRVVVSGNNVDGTGGFGGAVRTTGGTLNITDSTIASNAVGAGTVGANGGGIAIYTSGTLNLTRSAVSGNTVDAADDGGGGGIYLDGTATITNSTISGNHSGTKGGGGVLVDGGSATILNSTITGNDTAAGGFLGGGVIANGPTVTVKNSIISGNLVLPATANNCTTNSGGSFVNNGGNVENATTCPFGPAKNPFLSALGSFGGPTSTFIPQLGSQALNAVTDCTGVTTDQRGVSRPQDGACDAGAFELRQPTATTAAATSVGETTATLNGTIANPESLAMVTDFQYGTTTAYGSTTSPQGNVPAAGSLSPAVAITGLSPGTTYHFRIVASGVVGTVFGADQTFTTASPAPGPGPGPGTENPAGTGNGTPTIFMLGGRPLFDGSSVVNISVGAPGPGQLRGELTLLGNTNRAVTSAKRKKPKKVVLGARTLTVNAAGTVKLAVPLNVAAKNRLKGRRKVKAKLTVTFTPAAGGKRSSKSTTITLMRKKTS